MCYRIVITDSGFPNNNPEIEILKELGKVELIHWKTEEELKQKTASADALLVQWAPVSPALINSLQQCKIIVRYGIGVDNIDTKAASAKGIPVCNVPDYCIDEVADHTITLAISSLRQITTVDRNVRSGIWSIVLPNAVMPFYKMVFGLAGFGRIARKVALKAKALGFLVKAYDPYIDEAEIEKAGVIPVQMEELLEEADVLSLHLPLNDKTKYLINSDTLALMKPSSLVVNTSRGGLINLNDLSAALTSNKLWGAALDVFDKEPIEKESPILNTPGVTLSSHVAWYSSLSVHKLQQMAAEEVARGLRGETVCNPVK